jgi:hypothetical protein
LSPGKYVLPQAYVEDMYNPSRYGRTGTGSSSGTRRNERDSCHSAAAPRGGAGGRSEGGGDFGRRGLIDGRQLRAWVVSLGTVADGSSREKFPHDRRPQRQAAARLCDGGRPLAAAGRCEDRVDPGYLKLLLAYEDRRFWSHCGVDPLALGRAALQFGSSGHIVSGGSTITMQLARLMEPRRERSVYAKLRQMVRAVQIERQLSKDEILDLYLALAPFGGNLEGIRAASIAYFGKEPKAAFAGGSSTCWSRCRNRRNAAGSTVIRKPRTPRATACWPGWSRMAWCRKTTRRRRGRRRCRGCASRCQFWRRIPPMPRWRR